MVYGNEDESRIYMDSKMRLFRDRLDRLNIRFPSRGQLLDIGSAYGAFMKMAQADGWTVEGIEIVPEMAARAAAKGFKVHTSPIEQAGLPDENYEVVTCFEVLCLMQDPVMALKEISRILKPGGMVCIRDYNAKFHLTLAGFRLPAMLGLKPAILHDFNFTPDSFRIMLEKAGFTDIDITNSKPTRGDPYGTGGRMSPALTGAAKVIYYLLAQAVWFLSSKKVFAGSAIEISARKKVPL